jgi:REP element-mobilizing transposase RayT
LEPGVVEAFLTRLLVAAKTERIDIWAYVVMPEHCHILLYPREEDLPDGGD